MYRLNETAKALEVINKAKNPEVKQKELKAQILYRLEKYDESYAVYRDILKNTSDDEFEVLKTVEILPIIHLVKVIILYVYLIRNRLDVRKRSKIIILWPLFVHFWS